MKPNSQACRIIAVIIITGLVFASTQSAWTQSRPTSCPTTPRFICGGAFDNCALEDQWNCEQKLRTPGPAHKQLEKLVGEWETITTLSQFGERSKVSRGVAHLTMELGDRFLREEETFDMQGVPTKSIRLWGYNTSSGRYESNWRWTWHNSMISLRGRSEDDGVTVNYDGGFEDASSYRSMHVKMWRRNDDHFEIEVSHGGPSADPRPFMLTTYDRKK